MEESILEEKKRQLLEQLSEINLELEELKKRKNVKEVKHKGKSKQSTSEPTSAASSSTTNPKSTEVYKKRKGCNSEGADFEIFMCSLYALKLSISDEIVDFYMTSNEDDCGDFDDIKLEIKFKNGTERTFFFQLKHKEDNKKSIGSQQLFSDKGDFSLPKYFKSFPKISAEDSVDIIYTNVSINGQGCFNSDEITGTTCSDIEYNNLLLNCQEPGSNTILQFTREADKNQVIYLFGKQRNVKQTEEDVKALLENSLQSDIYSDFVIFMRKWWSGRFILSKHNFITKVSELAFSPYLQEISESKHNERSIKLKEAIMEFQVTVVKVDDNDIVRNIWPILKIAAVDLEKTVQKFGVNLKGSSRMKLSKILWHMSKVPLIVKVDESKVETVKCILKFFRRSCKDKKIVLIGNFPRSELSEWSIFENLSDLMEKNGTKTHNQEILENFQVSIQGRGSISINRLLKVDEEFATILETEHLLKMSQLDLVVGEECKPLSNSHIPRNVKPHYILTEDIFEFCGENTKNSLVIFNCNEKFVVQCKQLSQINVVDLLTYLNRDKIDENEKVVLLSTNKKCSIVEFEKLCKKSKKPNVYLFQVFNDKHSVLILQNGSKFQFRKKQFHYSDKPSPQVQEEKHHDEDITSIQESLVHQHFDNPFNIFCAPPGMGKTTLMEVLYNTTPIESWAVYVNLIKFNLFLSKNPEKETILDHFFGFDEQNENLFISQFKKVFLKRKKIHVYLDGLDEVDSNTVDYVIEFIKYALQNFKVWISSRDNLREKLSQDLYAVPIEIRELNKEQQRNYIIERLSKKFNSEERENIVEAIFKSSNINNSRELLGIPLQLHIITEMFLNNDEAYKNLQEQNIFVLTHMYKLYFEGKKKFVYHKTGYPVELQYLLNELSYEDILEQYEIPALKTCLDKDDYNNLKPDENRIQSFLKRVNENGDKYGIIKTVDENYQVVFTHQTYAEYFACVWFKKNLNKVKILSGRIFLERYENLKLMFDVMLAENNPLHLAIIYKDLDQIQHNIQNINDKDFGGRTVLDLACSYGEKYPQSPIPYYVFKYYSNIKRESDVYMEIMKILLEQDANIKECDIFNFDAVNYSLQSKCLYPLEKMLEKKLINFNKYQNIIFQFYEPTILAGYAAQFGYSNLLTELITNKPRLIELKERYDLLKYALIGTRDDINKSSRHGNIAVLKFLLEKMPNVNVNKNVNRDSLFIYSGAYYQKYNEDCDLDSECEIGGYGFASNSEAGKNTILDYACMHGCYDSFETLIQNRATCSNGNTILHLTAMYGTLNDTVIQLWQKICSRDVCSEESTSTCKSHVYDKSKKTTRDTLNGLNSKTIFNVNAQNYKGQTVLHLACEKGSDEIAKKLIENADVNILDNDNNNALHYAFRADEENEELLSMLIDAGLDVNARNKSGQTALHLACEEGYDEEIAKKLIENGADVNILDNDNNNTLHYALRADEENEELLSMLIDAGLDVNARNKNGQTALHLACEKGNYKIANKLIENGVDVNILDNDNNNTFYYASRAYPPNQKLLMMLIDTGLDVNAKNKSGQTALHLACGKGYDEIAKKLIENGADVNSVDNDNNNMLHYASRAYRLNVKLLIMLIDKGLDVNARNKSGQTALHFACEEGYDEEIAKKLIENGADLNILDNYNNNMLHYASRAYRPNLKLLMMLIDAGLDVNARNKSGQTALHLACKMGRNYKIAKKLIENGADVNILDNDNNIAYEPNQKLLKTLIPQCAVNQAAPVKVVHIPTSMPLFNQYEETSLQAACTSGDADAVRKLLKKGDATIRDIQNNTLLHYAVQSQNPHLGTINILINTDINIDAKNSSGLTAVHLACRNGHFGIMQKLIEKADVNILDDENNTVLLCALESEKITVDAVKVLVDAGVDINAKNIYGVSALLFACENNLNEVAKYLIDIGANVNAVDDENNTPLHYAYLAEEKDTELIDKLLHANIDINIKNDNDVTVLHLACENEDLEMVKKLVENGANTNEGNSFKETPLHIAADRGNSKIVSLLCKKKYQTNQNSDNSTGETSFDIACRYKYHIVLEALINSETYNNAITDKKQKQFYTACLNGNHQIVEVLLKKHRIKIDSRQENNASPIFVASLHGHYEIVEVLIKYKFDVNVRNTIGATPLWIASHEGHHEIVNLLITHGAKIDLANKDGWTPLHIACHEGKTEVVKLLIDTTSNGFSIEDKSLPIDVDKDGSTPLHHACYSGKKEVVKILIPVMNNWINMLNRNKETPLFVASFMGYLDIVKELMANGADQKIGRDDGLTPLKVAEERKHHDVIQFLRDFHS